MTTSIPLSFLDLTPIQNGSTATDALATSVELAKLAEELGYARIWYAEHHNTGGLASAAPRDHDRPHCQPRPRGSGVGSGGVMLPNHAPLKIAETFACSRRFTRAGSTSGWAGRRARTRSPPSPCAAPREALTADDYPQQVAELIAFDDESFPAGHPFGTIRVGAVRCPDAAAVVAGVERVQRAPGGASWVWDSGSRPTSAGPWRSRPCGHTASSSSRRRAIRNRTGS